MPLCCDKQPISLSRDLENVISLLSLEIQMPSLWFNQWWGSNPRGGGLDFSEYFPFHAPHLSFVSSVSFLIAEPKNVTCWWVFLQVDMVELVDVPCGGRCLHWVFTGGQPAFTGIFYGTTHSGRFLVDNPIPIGGNLSVVVSHVFFRLNYHLSRRWPDSRALCRWRRFSLVVVGEKSQMVRSGWRMRVILLVILFVLCCFGI